MADQILPTNTFTNAAPNGTLGGYTGYTPTTFGSTYMPPAGGGNAWTNMSPSTQNALIGTGTSLLGGYLSQRNQNQQNTQQQQAQAALSAANNQTSTQNLAMQLEQARILAQNQMGVQGAQASPTRQDWRQKQALLADILPQARNVSITPPGDLGRYMGNIQGGMRLPEGGLSPQALAFFSPQARLGAEQTLDKQLAQSTGGNYTAPDYSQLGYGGIGQQATQNVTDYASQIKQMLMQQQQQALTQAMGTAGAASPRLAQAGANPFQAGAVAR